MTITPCKSIMVATLLGMIVPTAICTDGVSAAERDRKSSRGVVDGSDFAKLADDGDMLIEVTLSGALLKMAAGAIGSEVEGAEELLLGIESISAVVVGVGNDDERAERMIRELGDRLMEEGWDRLARVRQEDVRVSVFILPGKDGVIEGITVVVSEKSENTLVFANIAGRIDLNLIAKFGSNLDIPGLEHLTKGNLTSELKRYKKTSKTKQ